MEELVERYGGTLLASYHDKLGEVEVVAKDNLLALHFDSPAIQTLYSPSSPFVLQLEYTAMMALAMIMSRNAERVLLIGLGGGALVHFLHHYFPSIQIDVIEKRPAVIEAAKAHFHLIEHPRVQLFCGDARQVMAALPYRYDVIFNDAYLADGPDGVVYAVQQLYSNLTPKGMLVSNLWQRRMVDNLALLKALRRYLPKMHYYQDNEGRNLVLFASQLGTENRRLQSRGRDLAAHTGQPFDQYSQRICHRVTALRWRLWWRILLLGA